MRITVLISAIIFLLLATTALANDSESVEASEALVINIAAPSDSYLLGELIPLNIEFVNNSTEAVYLFGRTEILISDGGGEELSYAYMGKRYSIDGAEIPIRIDPKTRYQTRLSILWNKKPDVSHLAPDWAERSSKGRILTDYAFIESGEYFVRVRHNFKTHKSIRDEALASVASTRIKISVKEPLGVELEVWNVIRQNGELAFLTQNGDFDIPFHKTEERDALVGIVENLIGSYPKTVYSRAFRKSLEIYRLREIKRHAEIELLKRPSRPDIQFCQLNLCRCSQQPN